MQEEDRMEQLKQEEIKQKKLQSKYVTAIDCYRLLPQHVPADAHKWQILQPPSFPTHRCSSRPENGCLPLLHPATCCPRGSGSVRELTRCLILLRFVLENEWIQILKDQMQEKIQAAQEAHEQFL